MAFIRHSLFFLLALQSSQADISLTDFIFWTKEDIKAWHEYFPSRLLQQEQLTIEAAQNAYSNLYTNMETNLAATVKYQVQELDTAQYYMDGTSAHGCVNGISSYMNNAVQNSAEAFRDCVGDVPNKLSRLSASLYKISSSYNATYQKVLGNIDGCARTYPNKDSWSRLRACVNAWINSYFTAANSTVASLGYTPGVDVYTPSTTSKSMVVFNSTVATCAQSAVAEVVAKGKKFLGMLVQCAKLSENVDSVMYEEELTSEYEAYITSNDLTNQIWLAININNALVAGIEQQMTYSYDLQKRALERYVIESRSPGYYYGRLSGYVWKYLNTIASTSSDNPANADCVTAAYSAVYKFLDAGATKALECDSNIVNNTKFLLARANNYFSQINKILPYTGNVALLSCFSKGYIFAEQTIINCYNVELNSYKLNITELNKTIVDDIQVLLGYEASFYSNSSLPCGDSILGKVFLEAERSLYNLQRCLYINTGTKYAVTTIPPYTTTAVTTELTPPPYTTTAVTPAATPTYAPTASPSYRPRSASRS